MLRVFDYDSYKEFLKAVLIGKNLAQRGLQAQLARAAGCHPSYLAQALGSKVELTPDHAAGIASFLRLRGTELEYFLNLVNLSRASSMELKRILLDKLNEIKRADQILSHRIEPSPTKSLKVPDFYYSSWIWMAIHRALAVDRYQRPSSLAERFNVSTQSIIKVLEKLKEANLVVEENGIWSSSQVNVHLPETSYMNEVSHRNWRHRALIDIEKENQRAVHYTSIFSMSLEDAERLRAKLLQVIQETRELIEPSPSEEVFCLTCDFFEA